MSNPVNSVEFAQQTVAFIVITMRATDKERSRQCHDAKEAINYLCPQFEANCPTTSSASQLDTVIFLGVPGVNTDPVLALQWAGEYWHYTVYRTSPPQAHYAPAGWLTPVIYVYLLQWGDDYPCGVRLPLGVPMGSICHWGTYSYFTLLVVTEGLLVQYPGSLIIRNKWSLKLWNAHNNQSIPVSTIWSYIYIKHLLHLIFLGQY